MSTNETKKPETDEGCRHRRRFWKIPFVIAFVLIAKAFLVRALWNHLVPELFHGPEVTFGQALGLIVLAKLLIGFHGGFRPPFMGGGGPHAWRKRWLAHLTPEERARFRERVCRHGHGEE